LDESNPFDSENRPRGTLGIILHDAR